MSNFEFDRTNASMKMSNALDSEVVTRLNHHLRSLTIHWNRWLFRVVATTTFLLALLILSFLIASSPWFVVGIGIVLGLLVALIAMALFATSDAPFWIRLCLLVVICQLILNYGFATIIIPIGGAGLPLSELVLLISLPICFYHMFLSRNPIKVSIIIWLLIVWSITTLLVHLPVGYSRHGLSAARDALPTLEVLFLVPGFIGTMLLLERSDKGQKIFSRALGVVVLGSALYGLGYGFQDAIQRFSPRFPSIQQYVPAIGSYQSWPMMGLFGMLSLLLWRWQSSERWNTYSIFGGALVAISGIYTLFAVQSRGGDLFVVFFLVLMLFIGGQFKRVLLMALTLLAAALFLILLEFLGVEFKGRISSVSASQIFDHLFTLSGESRTEEFQGAAGGIGQRRAWIAHSLGLWQQTFSSIVYGIGYGQSLTDHIVTGFQGQTIVVREPHNSFISILTRTGLVGLAVLSLVHISIFISSVKIYRKHLKDNRSVSAIALGLLFIQTYCLFNALGQPALESPHFAVPLYFLMGVSCALSATFNSPRSQPLDRSTE